MVNDIDLQDDCVGAREKLRTALGEDVCETFDCLGISTLGPHRFSFLLHFPDRELVEAAANRLRVLDFQCEVEEEQQTYQWSCVASKEFYVDVFELNQLGNELFTLAKDLGGQFDGWERHSPEGEPIASSLAVLVMYQLYDSGDFERVISFAQETFEVDGEEFHSRVLPTLGRAFFMLSRFREAADTFEKLLQYLPDDIETIVNLGACCTVLGEHERALTYYCEALLLDPENGSAHYNVCCSLVALNRYEEAFESLEKALRFNSALIEDALADEDLTLLRVMPEFEILLQSL